ncbi:MAG: addiction module protein [Dermabacteraceae bacterium]|uniref:addiction module protein n=1 Tax=unclassified Brachybacterium TaxID=2623841 RepID=UPI003FB9BF17
MAVTTHPPGQRIQAEKLILADELWEEDSEGSDPAVDAAWQAEFRRRIDSIESGKVELVDGRETMRIAHDRLAERRARSVA